MEAIFYGKPLKGQEHTVRCDLFHKKFLFYANRIQIQEGGIEGITVSRTAGVRDASSRSLFWREVFWILL